MESVIITMFSLIASSVVFFTACWALLIRLKSKTSKNLPPGPPTLPIIGNLHQLGGPGPHRVFKRLAQKYGPIMHLQLGQLSTIVISSPRLAQDIMKTQDAIFADRPSSEASELFFYNNKNIAWAPYGNYWKQMRKLSTLELLSTKRVRASSFIRAQELTRLRETLESTAGQATGLRDMVVKYVNTVILRSCIGDTHKDQSTLIELIFEIMKAVIQFNADSFFPSARFINVITGKKGKWLKDHKKFDTILQEILEKHRSNRSTGKHDDEEEDLVDVLLRVQETADLDMPITDNDIKAVVLDMLIAGTTPSVMIEWAMTEMLRQPNIMKKAQDEVRATVKGSTITDTDIQNLHYFKMVIKETFRLHGPPLVMPRISRKDCVVDGYNIPAKTRVIVNNLACSTDPDSWEDPETFIPERFENSSVNYLGSNFEFLPFGSGRRICPGINLGVGMVDYAVATMLYHFDLKLANGLKPHEIDVTEAATFYIVPKHQTQVIPVIVSPGK